MSKAKKTWFCFWKSTGQNTFYYSPARIPDCVSEYIYLISKNKQTRKKNNKKTNKQTTKKITKAKQTKEEKRISPENGFKKINLRREKIFGITRIYRNKNIFFGLTA